MPLLALFATLCGCVREDRAAVRANTLTILYAGFDDQVLGLPYDMTPKFLVFLPLATENAQGELEGRLARSWEHTPDFRTWTVRLRPDVRWQDGVPVTAGDVEFTLDLMKDPAVGWADAHAYDVVVPDDTTFTITYRNPSFGGNPLDTWTVYYPKHLLDTLDRAQFAQWDFWVQPVGDGPYRYVRRLPGAFIELEANPDYYRGRPRIDRVVLKFGGQPLAELLSGSVDVVINPPDGDAVRLAADPRFRVYRMFGRPTTRSCGTTELRRSPIPGFGAP